MFHFGAEQKMFKIWVKPSERKNSAKIGNAKSTKCTPSL